MNRSRKMACAGALMFLVATRAAGATGDALQQCVTNKATADDFSGVIAISRNGKPILSIARGKLAGDDSAAIALHTRFNLGSASKMFTAVAIGQLIDAGKIRLD